MRACQISREPLSDRDMKILRMILGQKERVSGAWKIENIERRWLTEHHLGGGGQEQGDLQGEACFKEEQTLRGLRDVGIRLDTCRQP